MVSPDEALRSMQRIWNLVDNENASVLLHHDPEEWRSYKLFRVSMTEMLLRAVRGS